jgi:polysaccharide biosynthesis protein PslJ
MASQTASFALRARNLVAGDAVGPLTLYIVLLVAIPSRLIFAPLGGAGSPAQVFGIILGFWWVALWLRDLRSGSTDAEPVRGAMLIFVGAVLASYIAATIRPTDSTEMRAADMGMLSVCAWLGVLLTLSDRIPTFERLDILLRRLVVAGGCLAALGIAQFITKQPFTNYVQVPGLSANNALVSISDRSGLTRPAGTALHPIEFGVVLTMILPFALHYALSDTHRSGPRRWWPAFAIAVALPIAISRSAIVGMIIGLAFLLPTWPRAVRRRAYVAFVALGGLLYVTIPGLLGTLTGLFTGIGSDSSAQSRTGSYMLAGEFISHSPIFGRGFATFLPAYRILDNQYLGVLIDMGFVGLTALLILFATGIRTARVVRHKSTDPRTRQLAQATAASIAAVSCGYALFDAFSFPMVAGMTFFVVGIAGSLNRIQNAARPITYDSGGVARASFRTSRLAGGPG